MAAWVFENSGVIISKNTWGKEAMAVKEAELIQLLQERDERGMDALLQHYSPLMRYVIAPILSDVRDAEECLSEAALRIWEKIDLYDGQKGPWKAWVTAVTRRVALNKLRTVRESAGELHEGVPSAAPTPEEELLQKEQLAALQAAIGKLDYEDRILFYRKYYYRQSTRQIAAELGTTERAVEGKLYRLKKQLRRELGGDADE